MTIGLISLLLSGIAGLVLLSISWMVSLPLSSILLSSYKVIPYYKSSIQREEIAITREFEIGLELELDLEPSNYSFKTCFLFLGTRSDLLSVITQKMIIYCSLL